MKKQQQSEYMKLIEQETMKRVRGTSSSYDLIKVLKMMNN